MISTEKAFEMLPDVMEIFEAVDVKDFQSQKDTPVEQVGKNFITYLIKSSVRFKQQIFSIVSIIDEKPIEEIKKQSFILTIQSIKSLFEDKEIMDFFKQAMQ